MFDQVVHKIDLLQINILSARIKQLDTLLYLYRVQKWWRHKDNFSKL